MAQLEADYLADPAAFVSEGLGQFRADLETYASIEVVEAVMGKGQTTIPYDDNYHHFMFVDPAGGSGQDSAALCVARAVPTINTASGKDFRMAEVCLVVEYRPKFRSSAVVEDIVRIADEYHIAKIHGDNFSGGMFASNLKDAAPHIVYTISESTKSVLYRKFLPLMTGLRVKLPDNKMSPIGQRILDQIISLETTGDGKVDAAGGAPEDVANVVAGACVIASEAPISDYSVDVVRKQYGRVVPPFDTNND